MGFVFYTFFNEAMVLICVSYIKEIINENKLKNIAIASAGYIPIALTVKKSMDDIDEIHKDITGDKISVLKSIGNSIVSNMSGITMAVVLLLLFGDSDS